MQRDQKQLLAGETGPPGNSQYKDHFASTSDKHSESKGMTIALLI